MTTIERRGLVKRYRSTLAVNGLTFDVRPGTVTGFLGPNGAGNPATELRRSLRVGNDRRAPAHAREPSNTKFAGFGLRWHRLSPSKAAGPSL
jgi:ATPase subunit of ABC transporter with duplicated ATPase domains